MKPKVAIRRIRINWSHLTDGCQAPRSSDVSPLHADTKVQRAGLSRKNFSDDYVFSDYYI